MFFTNRVPSFRSELASALRVQSLNAGSELVVVALGGETNCFASAITPAPHLGQNSVSGQEYLVVCPQYHESDVCQVCQLHLRYFRGVDIVQCVHEVLMLFVNFRSVPLQAKTTLRFGLKSRPKQRCTSTVRLTKLVIRWKRPSTQTKCYTSVSASTSVRCVSCPANQSLSTPVPGLECPSQYPC